MIQLEVFGVFQNYSNPTGETYSKDTIEGLIDIFNVKPEIKAESFGIMLTLFDFEESEPLVDIFSIAKDKGEEDLVIGFGSTSKITYAGAGIGFIALSELNQALYLPYYSSLIIGPDKMNQLEHVKFFSKE